MKHQAINLVKFKALSQRLKLPLYRTVGLLDSLWIFCQIQARDGDLTKFTALEIAGWLEWDGDVGEQSLIDALVETHWLDRDIDGLRVHDWDSHKPNWLKGVDASPRTKKRPPSGTPSGTPSESPSDAPSETPSATPPNLTQPNLTKESLSDSSSEPPAATEQVVLTFPTVGKQKLWGLTKARVSTLADAYPDLNILAESRRALAWIEANQAKRKTARGMPRFLNGWMDRAQNSGRGSASSPKKEIDLVL